MKLSLPLLIVTLVGCGGVHPSDDEYFSKTPSTGETKQPITTQAPTAGAQRLATITNDRDAMVNTLDLKLDGSGNVVGVIYSTEKGGAITQKEFTTAQIGSGYGVTLEEQSGVQAVMLRGQIDAATGTGLAAIRFISNGMTGSYAECPVRINRSPAGTWSMSNVYTSAPVSALRIISWSLGITTFSGICKT